MTKRQNYQDERRATLAILNAAVRRLRAPRRRPPPKEPVHVSSSVRDFYRHMGFRTPQFANLDNEDSNTDAAVTSLGTRCRGQVDDVYIKSLVHLSEGQSKRHKMATDPRFNGKAWRFFGVKDRGFAVGRFLDAARFGAKIFFIDVICGANQPNYDVVGALFREIEAEARRHGCTKLWLAALEGAVEAYRARGFRYGPVCEHDTAYPPGAVVIQSPNNNRTRGEQLTGFRRPARYFQIQHLQMWTNAAKAYAPHRNFFHADESYLMTKCLHGPKGLRGGLKPRVAKKPSAKRTRQSASTSKSR